MQKGIIGKKIGMTQIFDEAGKVVPVTVVEAGPCVVVQKKTVENDGYAALQLGYGDVKVQRVNKPMKGHFDKADVACKKELKEFMKNYKYPSISYEVADEIQKASNYEVRVTVPGHTQRGGSPCPYDRVFASRLGSEAGKLIMDGEYGFMVGIKNREIIKVPLEEVAGKLKYVSPDATIIKEAKMLGISFGD